MRRERFAPTGFLALLPKAYGESFDVKPIASVSVTAEPIAVVTVRGPLMQHESWWEDNYDAIRARVAEALASSAKCVVIDFDSPGGVVSGCFDTARALRAMADAAGKPMIAYTSSICASAAYALACACDQIVASSTAVVGSIGVIDCVLDVTQNDAAFGLKFALIASGARKTDGNPHSAISEQSLAAAQTRVNDLAEQFFALVAERRSMSVEQVRGLNADTFIGQRAMSLQLIDSVETFDSLAARLTSSPNGEQDMSGKAKAESDDKKKDETLDALVAATQDEDPKKAAKAKKALAAYLDDAEEKDDKAENGGGDDDDESKPPKDKEEASAIVTDPGLRALAEVHTLRAEMAEKERETERASLIASRDDFTPEMCAILSDKKKTPLATVKHMVATLPKGPKYVAPKAKAPTVAEALAAQQPGGTPKPTQGSETQTGVALANAPAIEHDQARRLDRAFGMIPTAAKVEKKDGVMTFYLAAEVPRAEAAAAESVVTK